MESKIKKQALKALMVSMRPLASLLLKTGIGFREFAEISKIAFVSVATKEYGLRGRPTNISRVAVMTGLTRKEVRRIRNLLNDDGQALVVKSTPLAEIMHRWYTEPEFLDNSGKPRPLSFEGEAGSFSKLVKLFGGDIPPGAMRTELKRMRMIEHESDGTLVPLKRNVAPIEQLDRLITGLVKGIYPVIGTVAHNLDEESGGDTWVQRAAQTKFVRNEDLPKIKRIARERLTEFTESIDDLFVAYETIHKEDARESKLPEKAIVVGVYYFEEDKKETDFFG